MSLNWEYRKVTWLLFGLVAAHGMTQGVRRRQLTSRHADVTFNRPLATTYIPSVDQRTAR